MSAIEIHLSAINAPLCEVIEGPGRRIYTSTPTLVGLALLTANPEAPAPAELTWTDLLASHGVAVGVAGPQQLTVAVWPAATHTVIWTHRGAAPRTLTLTFPPLLAALAVRDHRHLASYLWCLDTTQQASFGVASPTPVLAPFPYGNVYPHGAICWGEVVPTDIVTIPTLAQAFWHSGFNHDLFMGGVFGGANRLTELADRNPVLPPPATFPLSIASAIDAVLAAI